MYSLEHHGDRTEQAYWAPFLRDEFPYYGEVWACYIVPLTGRPHHLNFKTDAELAVIGRGPPDICNAQLHYTTLMHLARVWDLRQTDFPELDLFIEAIVRLAAATDVADELLQRATEPTRFDPWAESMDARRAWRRANGFPLQALRGYRNRLLHGRLPPYAEGDLVAAPKIGTEARYLDWRTVLPPALPHVAQARINADFEFGKDIVRDAWTRVLAYLNREWQNTLVPKLCSGLTQTMHTPSLYAPQPDMGADMGEARPGSATVEDLRAVRERERGPGGAPNAYDAFPRNPETS